MCIELIFLDENCGFLHGDISINNLIIVRFLPSIFAALEDPIDKENNDATTTTSTSVSAVVATNTVSPDEKELVSVPDLPSCVPEEGFCGNMPSGSAIIDFDYGHATGQASAQVSISGTSLGSQ